MAFAGIVTSLVSLLLLPFAANRRLATRPAARALASLAPIVIVLAAGLAGLLDELSLVRELMARRDGFLGELGRHLFLALAAVGLGVLAGVPLALPVHRSRRLEPVAFLVISVAQVVPTLSLLGLLVAPLAALGGAVPLALPVVLSGVRIALVQNMGNAILAALVGGGGLGTLIFLGLAQAAPDLILLGALSVSALALASDRILEAVVRLASPRGLRQAGEAA